MLVGQIADAICTPFVGYQSDKTSRDNCYGQRKIWHLVGTICVAAAFPFLFNPCITCEHSAEWAKFIYYVPFVVIFQFGWASTQISHLALIPDLTKNESIRVELNSIRYACTVLANIFVYGVTWLLLDLPRPGHQKQGDQEELGPDDTSKFRELAFIVVGVGAVFSIIFHIGTNEKAAAKAADERGENVRSESELMTWKDWLTEYQFYLIALLYMCTRLMVNVSQVYIPMYLLESLQLDSDSIAIIPLIVYVSGFLTSIFMRLINKLIGRKLTYFLGASLIIVCCISLWFKTIGKFIYLSAVLLGAGGSTVLVTSLSMTADMVGDNTESAAFVYGAMSFTDKLSNGLAVTLIQDLHPCIKCCAECKWYYRDIMVFVPGSFAVISLLTLLLLAPQKLGQRSRDKKQLQVTAQAELPDESETTGLLQGEKAPTYSVNS
ncbi:major facilitator superfamily domain-containing protein 12-like isoform X2 [Ptychodera flava]